MKKLMLFMSCSDNSIDTDLTVLGQLGVMHITPFQPAKDESIDRVAFRIQQLEKALAVLNTPVEGVIATQADKSKYQGMERGEIALMDEVLEADKNLLHLECQLAELNAAEDWYKSWGNISTSDMDLLHENGVSIKLYLLGDKELKALAKREDIQVLGKCNDLNQVALISQDANDTLDFEEVKFPGINREEVIVTISEIRNQINKTKKSLKELAAHKHVLEQALSERQRRLDVRNVQYGGYAIENHARCWKGYIPEDAIEGLIATAEQNHWGYVIEDPSPEEADEVPTLLRSPKWVNRIRPVMSFMGLVPGYMELDVSKVFLIFFTFFTGILVGDAGYGLVFLLITILAHWKQKFAKQIEFQLMYTLSFSIMVWGVLTGTYFGSEAIANIQFLSDLRVNQLASFGGDNLFIQKFMFSIGAVHLTIGHLQTAWKYINSVKAIAQLGWISIVWGLYFMVSQMVLTIPAPSIMLWLFVGGAVLVSLFSTPGESFFKGMLSSLGNLPLSVINGFSDIISYIRLYAVGLSTVLMATSFNDMAIGDGITTVASGIGAVIILVLGHGLNMSLAAMAVLVHGVRLNMLEYAGHAGVEFSGSEYNPFKLKNK